MIINLSIDQAAQFYAISNMGLNHNIIELSDYERKHVYTHAGNLEPISSEGCNIIWCKILTKIKDISTENTLLTEIKWWKRNLKKKIYQKDALTRYNFVVV